MPMHVGALHVLELPPDSKGRFVTALRKHMSQRLPLAPVLRRKLWWMPLNLANPAWVDAEPDLTQHIVEIKLPKGSGIPALEAQVSSLHPVLLDRKKPLWKFHVFEGLAPAANGNRRVALYSQLHHAAVDGQAAVALANVILDVTPEPRAIELRASQRPRVFRLEMSEMLRGVLGNQAHKVAEIVRNLPATVGTLKGAVSLAIDHSAWLGRAKGPSNVTLAPRTVLNASVTAGRAFASVRLPLPELKELGRLHGATVNDMVLMVCSTALRRYMAKRRTLPRKSLIAAVPISLRAKGDTRADNQASMSLISLGTQLADPARRLAHVKAATASMKTTMGSVKSILPTDFPSLGLPWLMEAATALYGKAKVADRIPQVANLVISNVPGPPGPLYMAGARMITNTPTSIIVHGLALNITVQSYDRALDFGLMADAAAMPDVRELADGITIAFDDLLAMPRPGDTDPDAPAASLASKASKAGQVGSATRRLMGSLAGDVAHTVTARVAGSAAGKTAARAAGRAAGSVTSAVGKTAVDAARSALTKTTATAVRSAVPHATKQPRVAGPTSRRRAG